jgi:hypothetical protein
VCHTNFNGRHPDLLVFDLDPGAGVAWEFVIESALRLRKCKTKAWTVGRRPPAARACTSWSRLTATSVTTPRVCTASGWHNA